MAEGVCQLVWAGNVGVCVWHSVVHLAVSGLQRRGSHQYPCTHYVSVIIIVVFCICAWGSVDGWRMECFSRWFSVFSITALTLLIAWQTSGIKPATYLLQLLLKILFRIIITIIIKYIYVARNRIMQLMRWINSHTANKNVFSLCLNVLTEGWSILQ